MRILSCESFVLQNSAILLAVPVAELMSGGYSSLLESPLAGVAERLLLGLLLVPRGYVISGLLTIWAPWDWDWEAQLG